MANKKGSRESKLSRYMKAPIRFLSKARDLYIQGLNHCSVHLASVDAAMGCPAVQPAALPRSFSVGSAASSTASDDYRELVRAASVKAYRDRLVLDLLPRKQSPPLAKPSEKTVPRSHSVGIGRIDEDKACDFEDDVMARPRVHARSKSHAVRRSVGLL